MRNYLVLGTVESLTSCYFVVKLNGLREPDHELRNIVRKAQIAFRKFFSDHGLFKISSFDEKGVFIDREYHRDDLTEEGLEMFRKKALNWVDSKSAQKEPPDYRRLEKIMDSLRNG